MNLDKQFHPLFSPEPDGPDDFEPRSFTKILVKRLEAKGPLRRVEKPGAQAMRLYTPEELGSLERFQEEFGGGAYEIRALFDDGRIYSRRYLTTEGDSKPLPLTSAETSAATTSAAPDGLPQGVDPMLALMLNMSQQSAANQQSMMLAMMKMQADNSAMMFNAMATMMAAANGSKESPAEMLRSYSELIRANQPPAPNQSPMGALKEALDVQKTINELKPAAPVPVEDSTPLVRTVLETVGPMAMAFMERKAQAAAAGAGAVAGTPLWPVP